MFLVAMALLMSVGGLLWGVLCVWLGGGWRAAVPFAYVALTALNLANLRLDRNFARTSTLQIALSLLLPFALQWALGGFGASGAMGLWSLLALLGSLTVQRAEGGLGCIGAFLGLLGFSVVIDPYVHAHVILHSERDEVLAAALNVGIVGTITFALTSYFVRSRAHLNAALAQSNRENERLIRRMLPVPVAERLRAGEDIIADHLPATTVVFCDIVGFTSWAQDAHPIAVVDTLRALFSRFDQLTRKHGLEKIKTIGDAYMAASGVPVPQADHLTRALALAQDMLAAVRGMRAPDGQPLQVRVGMHTGPVVAGVIGHDKVLYDIWGATVNLASRLESTGVPGTIHITEGVRRGLGPNFRCVPRGPQEIRGIGAVQTYLIYPDADGVEHSHGRSPAGLVQSDPQLSGFGLALG
jgi:guanylate cyclase